MLKDRRDQVHAGSEIAEKGTASREKDAEVGPEKWLKKQEKNHRAMPALMRNLK